MIKNDPNNYVQGLLLPDVLVEVVVLRASLTMSLENTLKLFNSILHRTRHTIL